MKYLGIDQALQTTGFAIFDNHSLIDYGTFTIPANKAIDMRLGTIWKKLDDLRVHHDGFDYVFFEDCQQQSNAQTYHKLSMVKATVLLWCYFNDIKYSCYAPSHWRSELKTKYGIAFGRSRVEQKQKARELVKQIYNIDVDEDTADAICIGTCGIQEKEKNRSAF